MNSNIPLIQAGRVLPGNLVGSVLVASDPRAWPDLVLEEHSYKTFEPADMSYNQHVIAVNIGASITCEYRRGSRWHHVRKHKGAISLFPSGHTFHRRLKTSANVLYLAIFALRLHAGQHLRPAAAGVCGGPQRGRLYTVSHRPRIEGGRD
jgi:hypothetical protein